MRSGATIGLRARLLPLALVAAGVAAVGAGAVALRGIEEERGLLLPPPSIGTGSLVQQQIALLAMGGLRSPAAEVLAIGATDAWIAQDWDKAEKRWQEITTLAPRRPNYWMRAAYDMLYNATAWARSAEGRTDRERRALERSFRRRGVDFLQTGLANNPDSVLLQLELARYYEDPYQHPDYAKAAAAYRRALDMGAAPRYERWVFYNLCRLRGHEREALELGRRLFREPMHRTPSVCGLIFVLQHRLKLPPAECMGSAELYGSEQSARTHLRNLLRNDLGYPTDGIADYLNRTAP